MVYFCLVNDFMLITDSETQFIVKARVGNDLLSWQILLLTQTNTHF